MLSVAFRLALAVLLAVITAELTAAPVSSQGMAPMGPYNPDLGLTESQRQECNGIYQRYYKLLEQGKSAEGQSLLDSGLKLYPNRTIFLQAKADFLKQTGKFAEALDCLNKLIAVDPLNPMWYLERASVEVKLKKFLEAEKDIGTSLSSPFMSSTCMHHALLEQSEIEQKLGRIVKAKQSAAEAEYLQRRLWSDVAGGSEVEFVARTKESARLIKLIQTIAQMGPHQSVSGLEELLKFKTKASISGPEHQTHIGGSTTDWSKITVNSAKDGSRLISVKLQVNPLKADLLSNDVKAIFGADMPSNASSPHGPKEALLYSTDEYDVFFMNFEYSLSALNTIDICWKKHEE